MRLKVQFLFGQRSLAVSTNWADLMFGHQFLGGWKVGKAFQNMAGKFRGKVGGGQDIKKKDGP